MGLTIPGTNLLMYGKKPRQFVQGFVNDGAEWNDFCFNIHRIYKIRSQMTAFSRLQHDY